MNLNFLDFEQPIAELEAKIEELRYVGDGSGLNINEEISRLQEKSRALTESIFSRLKSAQIAQLARHAQRPYLLDYVERIFTDFEELHGDRAYADDLAMVGGIGRLEGQSVMIIGQQKARDTKERVRRNYGMPRPEGYRKAKRLMEMRNVSGCRFLLSLILQELILVLVPKNEGRVRLLLAICL